jgi:hypothetical protein
MRTSPSPDDDRRDAGPPPSRGPAPSDLDDGLDHARDRMPEAFRTPGRAVALLRVAAAVLAAALVAGGAAGLVLLADDDPAPVAAVPAPRTAEADGLRLTLPGDWRAVERPGLRDTGLRGAVAVAPVGARGQAGLLLGRAPRTTATMLPAGLAERLGGDEARRRRVLLGNVEALRVDAPESRRGRTVAWLVPRRRGMATIVCFARTVAWTQRFGRCERVAATVARTSRARSLAIAPSPAYAEALGATLVRLNRRRVADGDLLRSKRTQEGQRSAALQLSASHEEAADALAAARVPAVARTLHAELVAGLRDTAAGFHALAAAASGRHRPSWTLARRATRAGEARVAAALRDLRELGYPTTSAATTT